MSERDLVRHLVGFCGALRAARIPVGLGDDIAAAAALTEVDLGDRREVERALVATLRIRPADRAAFGALFGEWWRATPRPRATPPRPRPSASVLPRRAPGGTTPAGPAAAGQATAADPGDARGIGYSPAALLRRKPFDAWSERDLREMDRVIGRLALRLATRRSRRLVPTRGQGVPDLRRSLRRAVATGGEALRLARRVRPVERPQLVLLCDTSGSMDPHTRFLLAFALSLRRVVRRAQVFAFNTELTPITPWLSRAALARTFARLAAAVPDWSGGTRIGECLADFVRRHLPWTVDGRTVVVILSDGLDRGDPAVLARAVAAIQRSARRLIWLNPLKGDPRYQPTARGMAAALPYIDHFAAADTVEALARVVPLLGV